MNLDPNNRLYLIDERMYTFRELRYWTAGVKLYSQAETLCLLGLIDEGLWDGWIYTRFNDLYPGRTKKAVVAKIHVIKKR